MINNIYRNVPYYYDFEHNVLWDFYKMHCKFMIFFLSLLHQKH